MTTEELREKVAQEMFYSDAETVGDQWKTLPDYAREPWRRKSDRILSLFAEAQRAAFIDGCNWANPWFDENWNADAPANRKAEALRRYPGSRQGGV